MTDQLPAVLPSGAIAPAASVDTYIVVPALVAASGHDAIDRFLNFFATQIENDNTREAYLRAAREFLGWCERQGLNAPPEIHPIRALSDILPILVAAWIKDLKATHAVPTVKLRLAAICHLFDWLVTGHIIRSDPALSVRGPRHVVRKGKTPVLDASEARALLDSITGMSPIDSRDKALIGLMLYSFARIGAVLAMKVEDVFSQNRRLWVRLHEKGGKHHEMPCNHNAEAYLVAYIEGTGIAVDPKGPLFRTVSREGKLTTNPLHRVNAYELVRRRAAAAGIATKIGNHSFRATGSRCFASWSAVQYSVQ
jgi:integrase